MPLVYRPVTKTEKFLRMEPTALPLRKSDGKFRLPANATVCGRLVEVVRIAWGGSAFDGPVGRAPPIGGRVEA